MLHTARLFPHALSGRSGSTVAGVQRLDLPGLTLNAAQLLDYEPKILLAQARLARAYAWCDGLPDVSCFLDSFLGNRGIFHRIEG